MFPVYGKVKTMKVCRGSRGVPPLILNLDGRWSLMVYETLYLSIYG